MISTNKIPFPIRNILRPLFTPKIPKDVSDRFRQIDQKGLYYIEAALKKHYFTQGNNWFKAAYLSSEQGQNDLQDHLCRRLNNFRSTVIPWLSSVKPLKGTRILEIGCGTGSSTVALAEQGANVIAIDILESSLRVAKKRSKVYNLDVDFVCANATELHNIFVNYQFDFIIFFASLEHMTYGERMIAMKKTWEMLAPGNYWCIIDTPNRLWYVDFHTSLLPFYQWLPDDLAYSYSRYSPRESFCDMYRESDEGSEQSFLRQGRGVSFHEFELTMRRAEELNVVSSLSIYLQHQNPLRKVLLTPSVDRRFEAVLKQCGPNIHRGFFQRSLDLIIIKD